MVKQKVNLDFENSSRIVNHPAALSPGDVIIKQDLDNAIAQLSGVALKAPIDIDCSGDPDYPACDPGQSFYVIVAGRIGGAGGVVVNIGDTIFCKAPGGSAGGDQATVGNEFFIVESNRDQATESELGVAALASQTEVNNGIVANKIVTPLTLQTKLNNAFNSRKYATAIGDGTNTTFTITHSLNDPSVLVQIRESNAPFELVVADVSWTDANNIQISFTNPPTTNQYTVSVR
ncbi:MAG: hypothetical protein QNJ65_19130 [Xenococcaceae cyanobacterium MO_234.B1]|nr:hypothetical protein [Xenococcaceae cyanobacterium MO_234.B1]